MNTNYLKTLLSEYEQKRALAISISNQKKLDIYSKIPEIEKIDNDISSISIKTIRAVLTSPNKKAVDDLQNSICKLKEKRTAILKKNGINSNDLEPVFECKKCNDSGYIKTSSGNELCPCIKQKIYDLEYNDSNIYDLENQNFEKFDLKCYSDSINEEKYKMKISPRSNMESIKKLAHNFIDNFDDSSENNLLFCGNSGLGKTYLSSCIANELIKNGKTVLYQTAPLMLDAIIDYKFGKSCNDISKAIYSADLLIIDDLGTETKNNLKLTELFNIINSRLLNQNNKITKTIISTNLSLQDMYNTYEERIVSRIIGNYNACYFFGDDIRIKKKLTTK